MLDTNMASYIIKGQPPSARQRLATLPMDSILLSTVTQAELLYGLERKGRPPALANLIREFLLRIKLLPWGPEAATAYGSLRASCMACGTPLGSDELMIAAHAISAQATLVTHDKAFYLLPAGILRLEDWVEETP